MRVFVVKDKGVPNVQPPKGLVMGIRIRVVRYGFHTRLERQWGRMVSDHIGHNLPWRLDASRSSMGCIQPQPLKVGAHWSYIVARPPGRRG